MEAQFMGPRRRAERSTASQEALSSACKLVDLHCVEDGRFPDVSSQLRVQSDTIATPSGDNDLDYPSFERQASLQSLASLAHVGQVSRIPLPHELVEQFRQTQCSCYMGLFPDIGRAWLSVDSNIYLWNFEDGSDLAYFDGLSEAIFCAGLALPKPGIFHDHIKYLLCLATAIEIVILGVSFSSSNGNCFGEMHLQAEPIFTLQTNNVHMSSFKTIENGRIFICARDGSLHEIVYQARDGWFTPRCRLVNHSSSAFSFLLPSFLTFRDDDGLVQVSVDGSRNILYTRSERGTLSVYDLGMDGRGMSKVASLGQDSIARKAALVFRTFGENLFKPLIYINAISASESHFLHLLAVSQAGVRLYFTSSRLQPGSQVNPTARPTTLSLVHCRLPPGYSPATSSNQPSNIHTAFYSKGTLLLSSFVSDNLDSLIYVHPDSFPFPPSQNVLHESFVPISVNGRSLAIAEVPTDPYIRRGAGHLDVPPIVTQHTKPSRRFVVLNTQGTILIDQLRPVDQLRALLIDSQGGKSDAIHSFFRLHRLDQACAMCLIVACSTASVNVQVAQWATVAFLHYGGEPQYQLPGAAAPSSPPGTILGGAVITPDVFHSGKHDGLYLYFSRLANPLWEASLAWEANGQLQSRFSSDELNYFLQLFRSLFEFLERVPHFSKPSQLDWIQSPSSQGSQNEKRYRAEAHRIEQTSLQNISQLIVRTIECIALWKIVFENGFVDVANGMTQEFRDRLVREPFRDFVQNGKPLCDALIQSLLNQFINDLAETGSISARLCDLCPSLFSPDDATIAKAQEVFSKAKTVSNRQEKFKKFRESLELFSRVPRQIDLQCVAKQFEEVGYFDGLVDLTLVVAKEIDPQDFALSYFKTGQPAADGASALQSRNKCYECVTKCLDNLLSASRAAPQLPAQLQATSLPSSGQQNREKLALVLQHSLGGDDELFHVALYDWLINAGEVDRLLEIRSLYLEDYLKRGAVSGDGNVGIMDLLWKYYEKTGDFAAAAQILCKLAERRGRDYDLQHRIEYLSRAVVSAKSSNVRTGASAEGEFLHELEEKLEVAHIQMQILQALQHLGQSVPHDAFLCLNEELMDFSKLYEEYADRFNLSECTLAILHSAGYNDPPLIENVWRDIINKELDKSKGSDSGSRMESLRTKIAQLGKLHFQSERHFPLPFLLRFLEETSCQLNWNPAWIFTMFRRVGASISSLYAIYDRLFKSKDPCWQSYGKPLHVLDVIYLLLNDFAADWTQVEPYERRSFLNLCLDAATTYLIELQSMPTSDPKVRQLIANYDSLQRRLQRMT